MLLRCIAEQANAIGTRPENAPDRVAALFLDIEKAYPSVPTDAAEKLFLRVGLPPVFVKLLVGVHKNAKYRVRTNEGIGEYFKLQKGFREGDPSSLAAVSLYHRPVMTHVEKKLKINEDQCLKFTTSGTNTWMKQRRIRGRPRHAEEHELQTIMFADDTTLVTRESYLREVERLPLRRCWTGVKKQTTRRRRGSFLANAEMIHEKLSNLESYQYGTKTNRK